jgi:hypothetical protein
MSAQVIRVLALVCVLFSPVCYAQSVGVRVLDAKRNVGLTN